MLPVQAWGGSSAALISCGMDLASIDGRVVVKVSYGVRSTIQTRLLHYTTPGVESVTLLHYTDPATLYCASIDGRGLVKATWQGCVAASRQCTGAWLMSPANKSCRPRRMSHVVRVFCIRHVVREYKIRGQSSIPDSRFVLGSPVTRVAGSPVTRVAGSPVTRVAGSTVTHVAGSSVTGSPVTRVAGSTVTHVAGSSVTHVAGTILARISDPLPGAHR
jgi:hypothetical protein